MQYATAQWNSIAIRFDSKVKNVQISNKLVCMRRFELAKNEEKKIIENYKVVVFNYFGVWA